MFFVEGFSILASQLCLAPLGEVTKWWKMITSHLQYYVIVNKFIMDSELRLIVINMQMKSNTSTNKYRCYGLCRLFISETDYLDITLQ